jgi:putative SOS response-associated peptidase YedK
LEKKFKATFKKNENFERKYHVDAFNNPKLPVITNENPKQIDLFYWGLIPFWVKDQKNAEEIRQKTANARAESIFEKPSYRISAKKKHCLVLADGFFEWRFFNGKNYPHYIFLKNHEPFAMAGLWEDWTNRENQDKVNTFTIITTKANPMMEFIHNKKKRMPVILRVEDYEKWINISADKKSTIELLKPFDQNEMKAYTISKLITSKQENPNSPDIIKPFRYKELESTEGQKSLF